MAATEIRLIVLATVRHLEPATGYAVRKHLVDQGIEAWGGVGVASIYSALRTLAKHGHLDEIGDPTGVRANTRAYRTTEQGARELHALWRSAIETVDPARPLAFHVAITLTALVTADSYVSALRARLDALERRTGAPPANAPAQTRNAVRLWQQLADSEAAWIRQTIELAQRPGNDLSFAAPRNDEGPPSGGPS